MALPSQAVRLAFEPQRSLAAAAILATYVAVGTAIDHPARMIIVNNFTDADVQFSFDGVNDHFVLAARTSLVFDIMSNATRPEGFFLAKGTVLYVKEIGIPATGSVHFSVFYGEII